MKRGDEDEYDGDPWIGIIFLLVLAGLLLAIFYTRTQ